MLEIRDPDTARIAVQAALTGHMVISTVHTNTALAAIPRLLDLGIEDYLLADVMRGVAGQRLIRRLCSDCARPSTPAETAALAVERVLRREVEPGAFTPSKAFGARFIETVRDTKMSVPARAADAAPRKAARKE